MNNIDIPKYPLYGYDNAEELDRDVDYMKSIYSQAVRQILKEVEEECDKMEYDGSPMFDETPDAASLGNIVDSIYVRVAEQDYGPLKTESVISQSYRQRPCPPGRYCPMSPCPPNRPCRPPKPLPDFQNGQPDWMRNLISSLLFNEMIQRRRRYRSRKQWF